METTVPTTMTISERIFNFSNLLGGDWWSFIVITIVAFGFGALMMGRALADTWRPVWYNVAYGVLLGIANRLFHNFFAGDDILNLPAYVTQTVILIAIALVTFRATTAYKMVTQYPWLYARSGPFSWRELS
jgi:branched-chain amino acid transport system ATP-binding protein